MKRIFFGMLKPSTRENRNSCSGLCTICSGIFFITFLLFLSGCSSSQESIKSAPELERDRSVDKNVESEKSPIDIASIVSHDELNRQVEEERARKERQTAELERRRLEEERLAEEKRLREENIRREETRRKEEQERRVAEEKLRRERYAALTARDAYNRQQSEYEQDLGAFLEEKRRREREERISNIDPDRIYFFRRDDDKRMPAILNINIPQGYTLKVYDLQNPLVMNGFPDWTNKNLPLRGSGRVIDIKNGEIVSSSSVFAQVSPNGQSHASVSDFVVALNRQTGNQLPILESNSGSERIPITFYTNNRLYYITGITTDGYDFVRIDAESAADGKGGISEYVRWVPQNIIVSSR